VPSGITKRYFPGKMHALHVRVRFRFGNAAGRFVKIDRQTKVNRTARDSMRNPCRPCEGPRISLFRENIYSTYSAVMSASR
jgi:hypothetical protein